MSWGKLENTFRSHVKLKRLARELGVHPAHARGLVAGLWSWALDHAPDGNLGKYYADEIAEAADWNEDPQAFVDAMISVGLIDEGDDGLELHEYMDRAEGYKKAEKQRQYREKKKESSDEPQGSGVKSTRSPRVPHVKPTRSPERRGEERSREERRGEEQHTEARSSPDGSSPAGSVETAIAKQVFDYYRQHHPRAKPGAKERRLLRDRIAEGYTADDICQAIDGCHLSPHHCGQNDRGTKYQTLELILRDSSKVTQFLEIARSPPATAVSGKTRGTLAAAQQWLDEPEVVNAH